MAGGSGVDVSAAGAVVALRGLTVLGAGGEHGIQVRDGAAITIEGCQISGFSGGSGVRVDAPVSANIAGSSIDRNGTGVWVGGGADLAISHTRLTGNQAYGVRVLGDAGGRLTNAVLSRTVVQGNR